MEIGQGVAVGRNDHARAAALPVGRKNGQHAILGLVHDGNPLRLGVKRRRGRLADNASGVAEQQNRKEGDQRHSVFFHLARFHLLTLALHNSR